MALPKLDIPWYEVKIPSTGKKTTYRPYLVSEEKVLLIALESGDEKTIARTSLDILKACVKDVDHDKLTSFDVEYLFLKIRSKSVGEKAEIALTCGNCNHVVEIPIMLDNVEVTGLESLKKNKIKISDDYTVEMRHVPYYESINMIRPEGSVAELMYFRILKSLYALHTEDERILFAEEPEEDVIAFMNSMTTEQFDKLKNFVIEAPQLKKEIDFTCPECSTKNKITLEGIEDFF